MALLWKIEKEVEIQTYSQWHINVLIMEERIKSKWYFLGFYRHPNVGKVKHLWELLASLKPIDRSPWCIASDFIEVLSQSEEK